MVDPFGWMDDGISTKKGPSRGFFGIGEKIE
jgi:hypothetical protein